MGAVSESGERQKTAGALVYMIEELGDARMRCDQLLRYVDKATKLIEKSSHKDHFFEVAGDVIQGLPLTALKLHKALQAVALAANRIDYEEIKQDLRPEKVEELERVLKDVRVRQVQRRSEPMLKPGSVVDQLKDLAKKARTEGRLDTDRLGALIASLEAGGPKVASDTGANVGAQLEAMAHALENPPEGEMPSRVRLAQVLRKTLAEHLDVTAGANLSKDGKLAFQTVMYCCKEIMAGRKPRRMVAAALSSLSKGCSHLGQEDLAEIIWKASTAVNSRWTAEDVADFEDYEKGKTAASDDEKLSRFEEGKSADPTKKMSPEDAKEWKENTEEHKDKFKKEARGDIEMMLPPDMPTFSPAEAATGVEDAIVNLKHLHRMLTTNSNVQAGGINRTFKAVLGELGAVAWNMNLPMLHTLLSKAAIVVRVRTADADSDEDDDDIKKEASIDAQPRSIEELEGVLEQLLTDARLARSFARAGNYKKMFFNIMKVLADVYVTTQIFDIPGTGFLQRVIKALMPYAGARPSTNFAALDEDKSSRFEEGKSADPTKKMSPEDAKEWKENTEEHKDNFKAASARWAVDSMSAGEWYVQKFDSRGDMYFLAQKEQKNGGWAGILVDPESRTKAKKDSVPKSFNRQWKSIRESDLPPKIKSLGESKTASSEDPGLWKVAKNIPAPDDGSIVEEIMSWHGGQGTNLYSVGSSWNSGRPVDADDAEEAYSELERKRADRDVLEAFEDHLKQHGVKLGHLAGKRAPVDAWKAA